MAAVVVALAAASGVSAAAGATKSDDAETVYYLGDPQIGFGHNPGWGPKMDEMRFAAVARVASAANATAVVIAGDLVARMPALVVAAGRTGTAFVALTAIAMLNPARRPAVRVAASRPGAVALLATAAGTPAAR